MSDPVPYIQLEATLIQQPWDLPTTRPPMFRMDLSGHGLICLVDEYNGQISCHQAGSIELSENEIKIEEAELADIIAEVGRISECNPRIKLVVQLVCYGCIIKTDVLHVSPALDFHVSFSE